MLEVVGLVLLTAYIVLAVATVVGTAWFLTAMFGEAVEYGGQKWGPKTYGQIVATSLVVGVFWFVFAAIYLVDLNRP